MQRKHIVIIVATLTVFAWSARRATTGQNAAVATRALAPKLEMRQAVRAVRPQLGPALVRRGSAACDKEDGAP
jgi:hypothetical protein